MSDELSPALQRELLDDFHSEADELLVQMHAQVAALGREARAGGTSREALGALYRAMHSLKGISGIVGLRVVEELAHAAEDVLRRATRDAATLPPAAPELLERTLQRLGRILAAHRTGQELPSAEDLQVALRPYGQSDDDAPSPPAAPEAAPPPAPVEAANWHATFAPSREFDARGVNVSRIRERLAALGPIVRAAPVVQPGGRMVFEFSLALAEPPAALDTWAADGVEFRPVDEPARPVPGPASAAPAAPAPESRPDAGGSELSVAPSHIVRVDLGRLDELMRIMGEIVIHRARLDERIAALAGDRAGLPEVNAALARSLRDLRQAITRVRLVPIAEIFSRLPHVLRDLAGGSGKQARLAITGQETEIDKFLVERLKEPLLHLVRNAVSHGVEPPAERLAAGKPAEATIRLRATAAGSTVRIEIEDDGRGIEPARILARARTLGLPCPAAPSTADLLEVLCSPGFSTRDAADRAAGRGVGMAVVHTTVRELGGMITLETEPGRWTRFTLRLPLTLSVTDAFIVTAGPQTCAVPRSFIEEVMEFEEEQVHTVRETEVIPYRDGVLPLVRLAPMLGATPARRTRIPVLVVSSERGSAGLVVDRLHGQREVVVRPMIDPLVRVRGVSGATELGDGRPVLILDPAALAGGVVRPPAHSRPTASAA